MSQDSNKLTLIKDIDVYRLSSKALADLFDVSTEMIRLHVNQHGMPRAARGQYSLFECVQWYVNRLKLKAEIDDTSDIHEEKLKLVKAQRQRVELENKKKRGELLDAEFVGTVYNQAASAYASQLDGLGARVASIIAGLEDPGEIQRVLFDECRSIRKSTAAELVGFAYEYDSGGDNKPAESKKRRSVGRRKSNTAKRKPRARAVANR